MASVSVQDDSLSSTIDDTERHPSAFETLNHHTDQTPSTYDILDSAVTTDTIPISHTEYSLATLWDAFETQSTMPGAHGGLKPWPNIDRAPSHNARPNEHASSMATVRSYYNPAQQPLNVSQQTSASSVRDMALRKGSPAVLRKDEKSSTRPLKSALKRYPSEQREPVAHPQFLYPPEHEQPPAAAKQPSRFLRFGNLFSRRSSSNKSVVPSPQVSRTPSTTSAASVGYAAPNAPRRQRSIGWDQPLQQYDSSRTTSAQSDLSDVVRQAKLAEGDVYERAKINIRRPPKGITNWFDGLEISSDEDDLTPVELPANEALPSTFTMFSPERKSSQDAKRPHPKDLEHNRQLTKAERVLGQKTGLARHATNESHQPHDDYFRSRDVEDYADYRAITPKASQQQRSTHGTSSSITSSFDFAETDTDGADRPSTGGQYSSQSDHMYSQATHLNFQRPQIPPRRLQNAQIATHNAYHVNERPRLATHNSSSKFSHRLQKADDVYENDRPSTSRKSSHRTMSDASKSRGRASTHISSSNGYDESSGGVSLDVMSPEISHMMAVTEEEMALLEMMRNKRAAMQKNSYSEGYRQALKREHEQLMQRRMLAQQTALRILRSQQQEEEIARQQEDTDEREVDEKEIRRLNKLKQQELDRSKRLEKFLAMDTSLAAALDDAGVPQDDLLQDWPLPKQDSLRSPGVDAKRSRKSVRTPSFSRRDVYDENNSRHHNDKHNKSDAEGYEMALTLPQVSDMRSPRHKQAYTREAASNLVRFQSTTDVSNIQRQRQALYTKQTIEDSAIRQELYMMNSQSAIRSTKVPHSSRQQNQGTTFLRSISDFQPTENNSITSQGSASISASVVSPMTPSSNGGQGGKLSGFGAIDSEEGEYLDHSSPELVFPKPATNTAGPRKKKQLPSALAILAESDPSSHRNSMASTNSAGEDVLAAWAELGGNEGMLPARSRRTRRA